MLLIHCVILHVTCVLLLSHLNSFLDRMDLLDGTLVNGNLLVFSGQGAFSSYCFAGARNTGIRIPLNAKIKLARFRIDEIKVFFSRNVY